MTDALPRMATDLRCRMLMGAAGTCGWSFEIKIIKIESLLSLENSWFAFSMTNLLSSISLVEESSPYNNSSVYDQNSKLKMILSNFIDETLLIKDEPCRNTMHNTRVRKIVHQNTHETLITKMRIKIKVFHKCCRTFCPT